MPLPDGQNARSGHTDQHCLTMVPIRQQKAAHQCGTSPVKHLNDKMKPTIFAIFALCSTV